MSIDYLTFHRFIISIDAALPFPFLCGAALPFPWFQDAAVPLPLICDAAVPLWRGILGWFRQFLMGRHNDAALPLPWLAHVLAWYKRITLATTRSLKKSEPSSISEIFVASKLFIKSDHHCNLFTSHLYVYLTKYGHINSENVRTVGSFYSISTSP